MTLAMPASRPEALLREAVEALHTGRPNSASGPIRAVLEGDEVGSRVFASALARRLEGETLDANLYLRAYEVPQIHLFNLLATRLTPVRLADAVANEMLCAAVGEAPEATVADIGTGTGRQMVNLLERLAARGQRPELTVVGIEPAPAALAQAEASVSARARELGLRVRYVAIPKLLEAFGLEDWAKLAALPGPLVLNEAFALHHVGQDRGTELRQGALERLRALDPAVLVLSEPNADHLEPDFRQRFANCWSHFNLAFGLLDELDLEERDRQALKAQFFGREIEDILGMPEPLRTERHETVEGWCRRLRAAGFNPALDPALALPEGEAPVDIVHHGDHVGLDYRGETLVGVIAGFPA